MSLKLLWILAFACIADEICCQLLTDSFSSSDSDSMNIFENFDLNDDEFITVRGMIQESRSIIMGIFRGRIPGEVLLQIRRRYPKIIKFFGKIAKSTRKCLKKHKTRNEKMKKAADCFVEAIRNRQEEEEEEEEEDGYISPMEDCFQEAMIESAMEAAPLMARAQTLYETFRMMMRETGMQLAKCREDISPIECIRVAWTLAVVEINEMRNEAVDIMYTAREVYNKYIDSMKYCMNPVEIEEPDEIEEDEQNRKNGTEVIKCLHEYDSVHSDEQIRTTGNLCDENQNDENYSQKKFEKKR